MSNFHNSFYMLLIDLMNISMGSEAKIGDHSAVKQNRK